jgi:hypothetical protein
MGIFTKLFPTKPPADSEARLVARIAEINAEIADLEGRKPAAIINDPNLDGGVNLRARLRRLKHDREDLADTLDAVRTEARAANEEAWAQEQERRWDQVEQCGVKLLATLQRLRTAIDAVGREYGQSITLLKEFSSSLPSRARDLSPLALDSLVKLRLGALTNGTIGTPPPIAPDALLEGAAHIIEQGRDHIAVALRARPSQPTSEIESTGAVEAPITSAGE